MGYCKVGAASSRPVLPAADSRPPDLILNNQNGTGFLHIMEKVLTRHLLDKIQTALAHIFGV